MLIFSKATLNRASLAFARSKSANFKQAKLKGADLFKAQLQGADFWGASLQGALLDKAQLQGASLQCAQLQGANLEEADLEGANLWGAQLQGAILDNADLKGATLNGAQLQGASLHKADLQGGSLTKAFVWRADAREANLKDAKVDSMEKEPKYGCHKNNAETGETEESTCDWTVERFEKLKKMIAEQVPEGDNRRKVMERIEHKLDPNKDLDKQGDMKKVWDDQERLSPTTNEVYERSLVEQWRTMGCSADKERPFYVFQGLVRQLFYSDLSPFDNNSPEVPNLADAFLDTEHCPGARGLSEDYKAALKKIAAPAAPQAPKP